MHDQGDDIADALTRLHSAGWSLGDTGVFDVEHGAIVYVVIGTNGENPIRAEGGTVARRGAKDSARPQRPRSQRYVQLIVAEVNATGTNSPTPHPPGPQRA
jgi:hypothetical protein